MLFLLVLVMKLLEKSPLRCALMKNVAVFDPQWMANSDSPESDKTVLMNLLRQLVDANRLHEGDADANAVVRQYMILIDGVVFRCNSQFTGFKIVSFATHLSDWVDILLYDCIAGSKLHSEVWFVVKQILLMPHDQATNENESSVNKEMEVENVNNHKLEAKGIICDYVNVVGGIMINIHNATRHQLH